MLKKIICMILCFTLCMSLFTGCNLIEHNYDKDNKQVVAKIARVVDKTFDSGDKFIYKLDLATEVQRSAPGLLQQNASNPDYGLEDAVKEILEQLTMRELILIETERLVALGEIEWGLTEDNAVRKIIYDAIDAQIKEINKAVLTDFNEPLPTDPTTDEKEPTFPTYTPPKTDAEIEAEENRKDTEEWQPDKSSWPGMFTTDDLEKSLQEETINRFLNELKTRVKDDFKVTAEQREGFKADDKKFADIKNTKGFEYIYPALWDSNYIQYIVGKSARDQVLIEKLQKWIEKKNPATETEIKKAFDSELKTQDVNFKDASAYSTAVKDSKTTLLYTPNADYFFVKHILIPFTAEEQADLKAKRALTDINSTAYPKKDVDNYRAGLVHGIKAYPHVDGENDLDNPMSVSQIFNEVYASMVRVSASPYEAERTFDRFIYKYNTDPGIFNNTKGYAVKRNLEEDDFDGYMEEFTLGATKLDKNYKVGDILPEYVVTDYGVHIMYYSGTTKAGYVAGIMDYETEGEYNTFYKIFKDKVDASKMQEAFTKWQETSLVYYQKNNVKSYEKTFKDLWKVK